MNFKSHYTHKHLLLEAIRKSDIIDLYIILAMPTIDDPAYNFVTKEVVTETASRIIDECENVILRELAHMYQTKSLSMFPNLRASADLNWTKYYKHIIHLIKLFAAATKKQRAAIQMGVAEPQFNLDFNDTDQLVQILNLGDTLGLPELDETTRDQWIYDILGTLKVSEYLQRIKDKSDHEVTIKEVSTKTGFNLNTRIISHWFNCLHWREAYGGEAWAAISDHVANLKEATSSKNFLYHLDRLVDLVHNTGTVLNKFKGYSQGWLLYILDLKAHAINIRELIPYASRDVQKLFKTQEWRLAMRPMGLTGAAELSTGLTQAVFKLFTNQKSRGDALVTADILKFIMAVRFPEKIPQAFMDFINKGEPQEVEKLKEYAKKYLSYTRLPSVYPNSVKASHDNKVGFFNYEIGEKTKIDDNKKVQVVAIFIKLADEMLKVLTGVDRVGFNYNARSYPLPDTSEVVRLFLQEHYPKDFPATPQYRQQKLGLTKVASSPTKQKPNYGYDPNEHYDIEVPDNFF